MKQWQLNILQKDLRNSNCHPKGNNKDWYHSFTCTERTSPHDITEGAGEKINAKDVVPSIDNNAKNTIPEAHYDHLDCVGGHNSLHAHDSTIHNGADDSKQGCSNVVLGRKTQKIRRKK